MSILLREMPPLRASASISTPDGHVYRWGLDEPDPANVLGDFTATTTMPGGFEQLDVTLTRQPSVDYADLQEFATVDILGPGGEVWWEGRLESSPRTSGDQMAISPGCVGWQAHLDDDKSARALIVHRNLADWQGPSVQRQIEWLQDFASVVSGASTTPDPATGYPAVVLTLNGPWTQQQIAEGWLDARGLELGSLYAAYKQNGAIPVSVLPRWGWASFLADDDTAFSYDASSHHDDASGSETLSASSATRKWGLVQLWSTDTPGGQDGVDYSLFWTCLAAYGTMVPGSVPLHGANTDTDAMGVYASDVVAYVLSQWAPKLGFSTGAQGSIRPSDFVIPHLAWLDPTSASQMLKDATAFGLQDWAVWEGPTFWWYPRNLLGRRWQARASQSKLQEAGPQVDRLYNRVVVSYADVTGATRTVGPPGAQVDVSDASLADPDPLNPVTQAGLIRTALLQMNTSTAAGAIQIGAMFLAEQKLLATSGQAALPAYVEDENGVVWAAASVRAGDQIAFPDSADPSYRRIVSTSYNRVARSNQISLDSPPDGLAALLARLQVSLTPLGFS